MKFSGWLRFSGSTLAISVVTTYLTALFFRTGDVFTFFGFGESATGGWYLLVLGLLFGAISLALFFSYQFIHNMAMQILGKWLWQAIQLLLILLAGIDLAYLRYINYPEQEVSFWPFLDWTLIILVFAATGAWLKVKFTNPAAAVPSVFFLVVATIVGAYYAFKTYDNALIWFIVLPVYAGNLWQLLMLPRYLSEKKETVKTV